MSGYKDQQSKQTYVIGRGNVFCGLPANRRCIRGHRTKHPGKKKCAGCSSARYHPESNFSDNERKVNRPEPKRFFTCFGNYDEKNRCIHRCTKDEIESCKSDSKRIIIPLDELTKICGFFSNDSIVNNYYNCKHPDCRDGDDDEESGKWVGACASFNCPLANDYESEDYKNVDGDHRMIIHDPETISKLSDSLRSRNGHPDEAANSEFYSDAELTGLSGSIIKHRRRAS